jgi:hypothetical protein
MMLFTRTNVRHRRTVEHREEEMMDTAGAAYQPDDEKLRELVLYISLRSEGDEAYGATKLNKLLFFADFLAYQQFGQPITGDEYQALPQGPAPRHLVPIREQMKAQGEIAVRVKDFCGFQQHRIFALREPDLSRFTVQEIDLVDRLIAKWWDKSASYISTQSHRFIGWRLAEQGETIPYNTALVGVCEPTAEILEYGKKLIPLAQECLTS